MFERLFGALVAIVMMIWMLIFGAFRVIPDFFRYRRLSRM